MNANGDWYNEKVGQVQERMRSLGQHGGSHQGPEPVGSAEAHRERLLFQNARFDHKMSPIDHQINPREQPPHYHYNRTILV